MNGGTYIREARKRAALSQRELAELLGTTQAVIARWEGGHRSPTYDRVVEAVRACGFDLAVRIVPRDIDHLEMVRDNLRRSPNELLTRLSQSRSAIDDLTAQIRRK